MRFISVLHTLVQNQIFLLPAYISVLDFNLISGILRGKTFYSEVEDIYKYEEERYAECLES